MGRGSRPSAQPRWRLTYDSRVTRDRERVSQSVIERCGALGFAKAGIAHLEPSEHAEHLRSWLDAGKHGSMGYLAEHVELRVKPAGMLEGARSAIVVADRYARRGDVDPPQPARRGRIARYARAEDYHRVIKRRLHALCDELRAVHPGEEFRAFTDTAPLLERELAQRAGIGWVARHTLIIEPRLGSYLLLGGVLTTLDLEPVADPEADHCGTCTRCIDACPTDAITPYSVDASRCISYLTIERREPIDPGFFEPMGDWLFGCDICQEVCPHNSARPGREAPVLDAYEPFRDDDGTARDAFDLLEVLGWREDDRRRAFTRSAMKRATLAMMKRNALIVAGNQLAEHEDMELRARVKQVAADESEPEMVRDTAALVLAALDARPAEAGP